MKTIARSLLTLGFIWLLAIQLFHSMGMDFRAVIKRQQQAIAWDERCYSRDEAYKRVLATAEDAHDLSLNVIWPSLLMLLGGVAAMRSAKSQTLEVKSNSTV